MLNNNDITPKDMYLDLLKKTLTFYLWEDRAAAVLSEPKEFFKKSIYRIINAILRKKDAQLATYQPFNPDLRENGMDWPLMADTMIGLKRLDNIQYCIEEVIRNNIPGDLIETGVWRGGATIFMRAVLKANGISDRNVWLADSFEGLPKPDEDKYPADKGATFHLHNALSVSLEDVKRNFMRYGLWDDQVKFLQGWFKDTLPTAPISKLAVLRLDGDLYESTMDALKNLYPKLSIGGFIIIDDFAMKSCKKAVDDYREKNGISDKIATIDQWSAYWRKGG